MQAGIEKILRPAAPEGATDFEATAASLKRCPDTNRAFSSSLWKPCPRNFSACAEALQTGNLAWNPNRGVSHHSIEQNS
jgi:hypothetical protein